MSTNSASDASIVGRWGTRFSWDNTFLSYHRNAMIATVAGGALIQQQKSESRTPLAGGGLLFMGGLYMYIGSGLYVYQVFKLARPLELSLRTRLFAVFNAFWPTGLWTVSLACLLDETPSWLLEVLRRVESHLPGVMRASLFLDPPALYPVCRLLSGVIAHEEERLRIVKRHAAGHWSLTQPVRAPLTAVDVASIIARRLERLHSLASSLDALAKAEQAVPTAIGAPLLSKLTVEVQQLEKVLEADTERHTDQSFLWWWIATLISTEYRSLVAEVSATPVLPHAVTSSRPLFFFRYLPSRALALS